MITAPFRAAWGLINAYLLAPLKSAFYGVAGAIAGALSGVTGAITAPFAAAWNWIQSNVIGPIKGGWNAIAGAINSVHISVKVPDFVPGIGGKGWEWSPPHVPYLAAGGLMLRSGLVFAHAGEVISPAPAAARARGGPLVNIAHAHFSEKVDVDAFGKRLAWTVSAAGV